MKSNRHRNSSGNRNNRPYSNLQRVPAFSGHLWRLIHHEQLITVGEIAEICDVSPKTVYAWSEGRSWPSPEKIKLIFNSTGSPEILEYFVNDTPYMLIERPVSSSLDSRDVLFQQLDIHDAVGKFSRNLKKALADGRMDRQERVRCIDDLETMEKEIAELKESLKTCLN